MIQEFQASCPVWARITTTKTVGKLLMPARIRIPTERPLPIGQSDSPTSAAPTRSGSNGSTPVLGRCRRQADVLSSRRQGIFPLIGASFNVLGTPCRCSVGVHPRTADRQGTCHFACTPTPRAQVRGRCVDACQDGQVGSRAELVHRRLGSRDTRRDVSVGHRRSRSGCARWCASGSFRLWSAVRECAP